MRPGALVLRVARVDGVMLAVVTADVAASIVNTAEEIVPAIESAYSAFQLAYMARRAAK